MLDMPIVSGNVSFYNETDGQPILPTPTIGAVGPDPARGDLSWRTKCRDGDWAIVVGGKIDRMAWPNPRCWPRPLAARRGEAPAVDLAAERAHGEFVREHVDLIHAATDPGQTGGPRACGFRIGRMRLASAITLDTDEVGALFGEDQARYLIACGFDQAEAIMSAASRAGIPVSQVGRFGGNQISFGGCFGTARRTLRTLSQRLCRRPFVA